MKAKVKILKVENISGTSQRTGNDYDMDILHILDVDSFDKFRVLVPKDQVDVLRSNSGKDGILELGIDAKTEKLQFVAFKVAA